MPNKNGKVAPLEHEKFRQPEYKRPNKSTIVIEGTTDIPLRALFRYATRLDIALIVLGVILGIAQGGLASTSSWLNKHLTDAFIEGQKDWNNADKPFDYDKFSHAALYACNLYLSWGAMVFLLGFLNMCCWHTVAERQVHQIRIRYFEAILRQNMAWFDHNETGAVTTRMTDGIDRIRDGIGDKLGAMIAYLSQFFGGVTMAMVLSWKMTLIMLGFMPLFLLPILLTGRFIKKLIPQEMEAYNKAGAIAEEVITGIRTVAAFNGQAREITRYETQLKEGERFGIRKAFTTSAGSACVYLALFLSMGIAFYFGSTFVIKGEITAGVTFGVFWAIVAGTFAIGNAAPQIGTILGARGAAASVFAIIDRDPPINSQSPDGKRIQDLRGAVCLRNIEFRYPSRPEAKILKYRELLRLRTFRGISLTVEPGQHVALVGHSGSGKSTLIGLLLRYYEQEHGQVTIDGHDVRDLNIAHLRQIVGVVSQEPALFCDTIANNLKLGNPDMSYEEMERVCRMANAHDFVSELPEQYDTVIGEGGVQLSGGQKQRIAIARALARNPTILLLDEATSALDTESESVVQQALDQAGRGRTTISIAHRLSTIKNADKIYVFDVCLHSTTGVPSQNGLIVEDGNHESLMEKNATYAELVRAQEIEKMNEQEKDTKEEEIESSRRMSKIRMRARTQSRLSTRLSRALSVDSQIDRAILDLEDEANEEQVAPSSILDIVKFAKPEWLKLACSLAAAVIRGLTFPIFSIVYGRMFKDGAYFDSASNSSGKLTTRLATDAPNIRSAIDHRLSDVLQSVSAVTAGISIAFSFSAAMAPIGVLTAGALIALNALITQYLKRKGQHDAEAAEEPSRLATEAIEQHKTVQYLTREAHFVARYVEMMRRPHKNAIFRGIVQSTTFALSISYVLLNFGIAYRYGVFLVNRDVCSPYIVFQVIEALNCASISLIAFATYFPEYIRARLSAGLLFNMLAVEPRIDSLGEHGHRPDLNGDIDFERLYFSYPIRRQHKVLNGLTLRIPSGKTVALVGPSGCGKSTSIQMIERYYDPSGGRVMFDRQDCRTINLQHLRSQISLVGQEPTLFNYSIKENIAYGKPSATEEEIIAAAKLANAHDFIQKMPAGYDTTVGERGGQLSGGQKQRIAIARAIIRNPKILLLDEATSALDTESERLVQEALENARAGRTCVVIAHRLSSIQNSDIIVVVKDGQIFEQGNHQSLLAKQGLYASLVSKQGLT